MSDNRSNQPQHLDRVVVYIDGFNLYFGLRESGWKHCYWLDLQRLGQGLVRSHQMLAGVKYFTSRVNAPPDKLKRQNTYLEAIEAQGQVQVYFGHYRTDVVYCSSCGVPWTRHGEKKTDVNIATELLLDAFHNRFDTALLVSGDGDLLGPVQAIPRNFPGKQVWVAFPPNRQNRELEAHSGGKVRIRKKLLEQSLLPSQVVGKNGFTLTRPPEWVDCSSP